MIIVMLQDLKKMNNRKQKYLESVTRILAFINLWPEDNKNPTGIKQYYSVLIAALTSVPILADFITQIYDDELSFATINENLVTLSALYGAIYVFVCYLRKMNEIQTLVKDLSLFQKFTPATKIKKTENIINFYTKFLLVYSICGCICYGLLPVFNREKCEENKSNYMIKHGIPCGLVIRFVLPFAYDRSPFAEIAMIEQIIIGIWASVVIVVFTMLVCGVLIHICNHLKHLKMEILKMSLMNEMLLENQFRFCLRFHTTLLNYAARANDAFDQMMLLHITLTGFIISVIGFQLTLFDEILEIFRITLHLLGWLAFLLIVCHYGQVLMDESTAVSHAIYSMKWYKKPVTIQKYVILILLRSQKPLTLKAAGLQVMSLATFMGVLYSAYSYFTLLLKFKS